MFSLGQHTADMEEQCFMDTFSLLLAGLLESGVLVLVVVLLPVSVKMAPA